MEILINLGVNLAAAFIGLIIGLGWQKIHNEMRIRPARRFWKPFAKDNVRIVIGRFSHLKGYEQSGFLAVGDAMALAELQTFLRTLKFENVIFEYDDQLKGDDLKTNLILLGGPDANRITKEVAPRINTSLRFGNPEKLEIAITDTVEKTIYAPLGRLGKDDILLDYGLILKAENPFDTSKQVMIIAGSFGFGTWAGVRFATSKSFMNDSIASNGSPVECLIKTDVLLQTPQKIEPITIREIYDQAK